MLIIATAAGRATYFVSTRRILSFLRDRNESLSIQFEIIRFQINMLKRKRKEMREENPRRPDRWRPRTEKQRSRGCGANLMYFRRIAGWKMAADLFSFNINALPPSFHAED
ncbi:hypothetical protein [Noviherbaspirillum sp. ST9]|uniref:hypothetical protein n=1 Tax=Noviherbaspirillum sp. ST9 TaxID=3401606 RepID=UPI003B58807E